MRINLSSIWSCGRSASPASTPPPSPAIDAPERRSRGTLSCGRLVSTHPDDGGRDELEPVQHPIDVVHRKARIQARQNGIEPGRWGSAMRDLLIAHRDEYSGNSMGSLQLFCQR